MWIAGVWNPFLEFPDLLQVLQEKVRQNVIWGYEKASRQRCFFDICPERNLAQSIGAGARMGPKNGPIYGHLGGWYA